MIRPASRAVEKLCLLLLLFSLAVSSVLAQSETATISGQVVDPSGFSITGAQVKLVDIDRDSTSSAITNNSGLYTFPSVKPGRYRMEVSAPGFRLVNATGLTVNVQDQLEQNFKLVLGSVSESMTVTADQLNVNTTDASVSTVVDRKFVENIPLNGRSFQDLISMTPGITTQSPQNQNNTQVVGKGGDFSVNGQRTESNVYTVDGVSANIGAGPGGLNNGYPGAATGGAIAASTALGTTQSLVSVDALQEFRVESSTYSAEYGGGPGGQFSLVTRSGANDFKGSVFEYLRNNFFDANDWFNDHLGVPGSALRQSDFGGTLGGPVVIPGLYNGKNKTFFFVSYEGLRLAQPTPAAPGTFVPDLALRQNAPPALQPILNAFPLPTPGGIDSGGLAEFILPYSLPSRIDSTSIRFDQSFSPKLSLFFRFGDTPSSTESRPTFLSTVSQNRFNTQSYTLGAISQFSDRANNEFHVGYARTESANAITLDGFGGAVPIDLAAAVGVDSPNAQPLIFLFFGPGASVLYTSRSNNEGRPWNINDTFSLSLGRHLLKFGMDYRRIKSPIHPATPEESLDYFAESSVLSNSADSAIVEQLLSKVPLFLETAAFFQDDWRVTSRVSLSLGLRWEVDPPPTGADGRDAYTLLGSFGAPNTLMLAPAGTPLWKTAWYNFAPRLGMAWRAQNHPGYETVVRTGGGVFFDTNNRVAAGGFNGIGFTAFGVYNYGAPAPLTPAQVNLSPSTTPPFTFETAYIFPQHLQLPYTLQWNTSIEQAMGKSQALTLSYIGAAGRRLMQDQTTNADPNPNFPYIEFYPSGVTSNYQALQMEFQRHMSRGLQALAAYTWSHSIDFGSSDAAQPLLRGNSDFDLRHNVSGGVSWELPNTAGDKLIGDLLDHWGLDSRLQARTGFPVTLQGNTLINPADGSTYAGNPNLVPGQPLYLYGSQYSGGRAINPAAFVVPTNPTDPGNAPRNFVRGFGAWQINLAVRREFPIHDKVRLQFRAEAFNVLNHPNFGQIDPTIGDLLFGQATQMLNQSLATLGSQYQQGGPRSMQFALRLTF